MISPLEFVRPLGRFSVTYDKTEFFGHEAREYNRVEK